MSILNCQSLVSTRDLHSYAAGMLQRKLPAKFKEYLKIDEYLGRDINGTLFSARIQLNPPPETQKRLQFIQETLEELNSVSTFRELGIKWREPVWSGPASPPEEKLSNPIQMECQLDQRQLFLLANSVPSMDLKFAVRDEDYVFAAQLLKSLNLKAIFLDEHPFRVVHDWMTPQECRSSPLYPQKKGIG